jgi:hypothetical protein
METVASIHAIPKSELMSSNILDLHPEKMPVLINKTLLIKLSWISCFPTDEGAIEDILLDYIIDYEAKHGVIEDKMHINEVIDKLV